MAVKEDRRVRRTKRLLQEAFVELVVEQGYDTIRIEDILERADIARTTFYTHFSDKRSLLNHVAEVFRETSQARLADIQIDENGVPTQAQLETTFANFKANAPFFRMVLGTTGVPLLYEQVHQAIVEIVETLLTQHADQSNAASTIPTSLQAYHFAGELLSAAKWWLEGDRIYLISAEKMATMFIELRQGIPLA